MNSYRRMVSYVLARSGRCDRYAWGIFPIQGYLAGGWFSLGTSLEGVVVEISFTRPCVSNFHDASQGVFYAKAFHTGNTHGQFL